MTPLESLKLEIREFIEAREACTDNWKLKEIYQGEWFGSTNIQIGGDQEFYKEEARFVELAANKSALLAQHLLIALEALEETKKLLVSEYGPRIFEVNFECIDQALDKIVGKS